MAAQLAVEQGIGMYKFPPEMLDHLPATAPTLHYRTCAVIGNSGELLQGQLGVEIDSHDAVIRLNAAPTKVRPFCRVPENVENVVPRIVFAVALGWRSRISHVGAAHREPYLLTCTFCRQSETSRRTILFFVALCRAMRRTLETKLRTVLSIMLILRSWRPEMRRKPRHLRKTRGDWFCLNPRYTR